jgi:ribonuclease J
MARQKKQKLKIIPLGGLGEIGKNMMLLEYGDDIMVIDAGLMFPQEDMLGVDLVIPDISYLLERQSKVRGIVVTHGHEDHIGALPYVLPHLGVPVYSTKLTNGLISVKLKEQKVLDKARLKIIQPGDEVQLGRFKVEFFRVSHSIPDSVGLVIHTPLGIVVHSGDFKLDHTPVDGKAIDLAWVASLGAQGVLAFFSDSTYAELEGYTPSERVVGETLDRIIGEAEGRVIIASFASLISRIQQVIDAATKHGRRVFVVGRSMVNNIRMASELGYLKLPPGGISHIAELGKLPKEQIVLLATGSQGEPTSALVRIASGGYRQVRIIPGDTVVISATAIPGNEALVGRTVDNLFKRGAEVLYDKVAPVHVHGHGSQEELKLMLSLVRPRFFVPVHGEYRHLSLHARLAQSMGIPSGNVFVLEDGDILELGPSGGRVTGKVASSNVYVDGLGVGSVGHATLSARRALSQEGIVVVIVTLDKETGKLVGSPELVSRGFAEVVQEEELMEEGSRLVARMLVRRKGHPMEWDLAKAKVRDVLGSFFYQQTGRCPMILPVSAKV